uniref:Uncharacterized protein n=1 Tax=Denticeps clupeoides TaxID=299321 RepID=A0AAY4BNB9_9TELE
MTSTVIVTQPQTFVVQTSNQWSTGICDCCEDLSSCECCFGFWCFWCFACKTAKELGECLCLPLMRATMRQRYGIQVPGTICNDCIYSVFCGPCVWCQMSREKAIRGAPITIINAGL